MDNNIQKLEFTSTVDYWYWVNTNSPSGEYYVKAGQYEFRAILKNGMYPPGASYQEFSPHSRYCFYMPNLKRSFSLTEYIDVYSNYNNGEELSDEEKAELILKYG